MQNLGNFADPNISSQLQGMLDPNNFQQRIAMLQDPQARAQAAAQMAMQSSAPPPGTFDAFVGTGDQTTGQAGAPTPSLGDFLQPGPQGANPNPPGNQLSRTSGIPQSQMVGQQTQQIANQQAGIMPNQNQTPLNLGDLIAGTGGGVFPPGGIPPQYLQMLLGRAGVPTFGGM